MQILPFLWQKVSTRLERLLYSVSTILWVPKGVLPCTMARLSLSQPKNKSRPIITTDSGISTTSRL